MPKDNEPKAAKAASASLTLYCPTCGRELINFAQHPDLPDRTLAYCVCNSIGPVLEYTTLTIPLEHTNSLKATSAPAQAAAQENSA